MKIAEELYQAGFISYPRTETDSFSASMDLMVLAPCGSHLSMWLVLLPLTSCSAQSGSTSLTLSVLRCC